MADSLTIQCPECQARMRLKQPPASGAKLKCPKCQAVFRYEDEEEDYEDEIEEAPKRSTAKRSPAGKKRSKKSSANVLPVVIGGGVGVGLVALAVVLWMVFLIDPMTRIHQDMLRTVNSAKATLDEVTTAAEADAAATKIDQATATIEAITARVGKLGAGKPEAERQIIATSSPPIFQAIKAQKASWRTLRESNRSSRALDVAQTKFLMVQVQWMQSLMGRAMPAGMPAPPNGMLMPGPT